MEPRRRGIVAFAAVVGLLCAGGSAMAGNVSPAVPGDDSLRGQDVVPGEVIVRYKTGTSTPDRADALDTVDASFERDLLLSRTELIEVEPGKEDEAAAALEQDPDVAYAEPNGIVHPDATPNDTRFGELWGLNNSGQTVADPGVTGVPDADIDAPEAWNMGARLRSSVLVAVADTGVAVNHPDLAQNRFVNPGESGAGKETNGIDDDGNGLVDDFRGWDFIDDDNDPAPELSNHGTHVAGTIAGRANNGLGVTGVASFPAASGNWPGPKVLPVRVLGPGGGSDAAVADGFAYAAMMGARVVNASLSGSGTSQTLDRAIKRNPNTLYVVAAGNNGTNNDAAPRSPCVGVVTVPDVPNKICVAATDSSDQLANFSNFGATSVDIAAPGTQTLSTVTQSTILNEDFETPLAGRWVTDDSGQVGNTRWGRTTLRAASPTHSVTDSPGGTLESPAQYEVNQDNWIRTAAGLDLRGQRACTMTSKGRIRNQGFDFVSWEASRTPADPGTWHRFFSFNGFGGGELATSNILPRAIPEAFDGKPGVFVRMRMTDFGDGNVQDGVYIDDVIVKCFSNNPDSTAHDFSAGTSMATPHVAGAAAFLFTRFPAATVAEVKDKILRSVDRKNGLNGKVVTGGRLNLYKAAAESRAGVRRGELTFTAGPGQRNAVRVRLLTDGVARYKITDSYTPSTVAEQGGSRITPGPGCSRVDDTTVECPAAGISRIVLNGGDGNDTLNAGMLAIRVTLDGGLGADSLATGSGDDTLFGSAGADAFSSGGGSDTINARHDDVDTSFECGEGGADTDTVTADATPNDPITASTDNCEVVDKE